MDISRQKTVLETRRAELAVALQAVERELDQPATPDWEDRSTERQGDEVLEALGQAELNELRRIDAALARIEDGSYGLCQTCGDAVSDARLTLLPDTAFCKNCAV
ncbi:TraR/DksA C4-type zinc finger protein [Sulfitobacter sp. D35]|uniref:TraR/DksA family transcriptional regulator n=1 Tax=Sulfitobacter sp. D35 TaxID=3083252 RepID=UPI00296ECDDA|nr:TraR/DksA C4-type zinc finger protein [Sulfitobacter sp. D35]MDW4499715.1 TraR/DksA C4-type zinc finger protein [Sulfitobacter sp. D35]